MKKLTAVSSAAVFAMACVLGLFSAAPPVLADHHEADEPVMTAEEKANADAADYLKNLKKKLSKMPGVTAIATATKLGTMWNDEKLTEDTKSPIPGYLQKIASNKDNKAKVAGIKTLAMLGPEHATKTITKQLGKALKSKKPAKAVWKACLTALGSMADPGKTAVKTVSDLLKYKDYDVINAAAHAIAGYENAPGKLRKQLFEDVIKQSEGTYSGFKANDNNLKTKWNVIGGGVMKALKRLSGKKNLTDPTAARAYLNDTKKDRKAWADKPEIKKDN